MPPMMDHNEFDFIEDLIRPFTEFLKRIDDGQKTKKQRDQEKSDAETEANTILSQS